MSSPNTPSQQRISPSDDDDLDDLDDVLDQFSTPSPPPPPPPTASSLPRSTRLRHNTTVDAPPRSIPGSGTLHAPSEADEDDEDALSAEFARELSKGMESLVREMQDGGDDPFPSGGEGSDDVDVERTQALKAAWEALFLQGMNGQTPDGTRPEMSNGNAQAQAPQQNPGAESSAGKGAFQNKIKQAMEKLKSSETTLQGDAASRSSGSTAPDSLEGLLSSLGDLGIGDDADETELAGFLETMMGQLMSKEVLYEPLKELADKFPSHLATPPAPISQEDKARYEKQLACVKKILALFDAQGYSDDKPAEKQKIVALMDELQSYGTPPAEIMGPLPPALEGLAGGNIPMGEDGCVVA